MWVCSLASVLKTKVTRHKWWWLSLHLKVWNVADIHFLLLTLISWYIVPHWYGTMLKYLQLRITIVKLTRYLCIIGLTKISNYIFLLTYRKSSNSGRGFYLLRLHSAPACIWGRLVLGAGLYFLLIIRLFRMFQKVPLIWMGHPNVSRSVISWYSPLRKVNDRCHWQRVLCF